MIDLIPVKKDMMCYVQDVRAVKGMGIGLLDHHVVLCEVRLVGARIMWKEIVNGASRIRSKKLREYLYIEGYAICLENNRVECNEDECLTNVGADETEWLTMQEMFVAQ